MKKQYPIGSVSSGTMRPQDLFDSFTSELEYLNKTAFRKFKKEYSDVFKIEDYDEMTEEQEESLDYAVESLFNILNEFAGPYFYFGAHPGDGADYGFWFSKDSFEDAAHMGEIEKCDELPAPKHRKESKAEYFAVISDHGNVTLYSKTGREVWSLV